MNTENVEDVFTAAAEHLQSIQARCSDDDLLYLYARYKQVTSGPCDIPKPTVMNTKARKKWFVQFSLVMVLLVRFLCHFKII